MLPKLVVMVAGLATVTASGCLSSEWTSHNGFCYWKSPSRATWQAAETACENLDLRAHLASVRDLDENAFLKEHMGAYNTWIGLNDLAQEGHYVWTDGTSTSFYLWAPGQPNNSDNQDCIDIWDTAVGEWNDAKCEENLPYICKMPEA